MSEKVNISIIIPIYNGEKYLNKLIESLNRQKYSEYEVIFINDGSVDGSSKVLEELKSQNEKVKVIHQKNKGISAARNTGISHSVGKYLIFFDQDDDIEDELILNYWGAIDGYKTDMAVFSKTHYYVENGIIVEKKIEAIPTEIVNDKNLIIEHILNVDNSKRLMTIWNCIYKSEIIKKYNLRFDEHFKHGDEDGMFNTEYALKCESIYFSSKSFYNYYKRKGISTITKRNDQLIDNFLYYIGKIYSLISNNDLLKYQPLVRLYFMRFFINKYIKYCETDNSFNDKKHFINECKGNKVFKDSLEFRYRTDYKIPYKYIGLSIITFLLRFDNFILSVFVMDSLKTMKQICTKIRRKI